MFSVLLLLLDLDGCYSSILASPDGIGVGYLSANGDRLLILILLEQLLFASRRVRSTIYNSGRGDPPHEFSRSVVAVENDTAASRAVQQDNRPRSNNRQRARREACASNYRRNASMMINFVRSSGFMN